VSLKGVGSQEQENPAAQSRVLCAIVLLKMTTQGIPVSTVKIRFRRSLSITVVGAIWSRWQLTGVPDRAAFRGAPNVIAALKRCGIVCNSVCAESERPLMCAVVDHGLANIMLPN
jgi:hypothetical protein